MLNERRKNGTETGAGYIVGGERERIVVTGKHGIMLSNNVAIMRLLFSYKRLSESAGMTDSCSRHGPGPTS